MESLQSNDYEVNIDRIEREDDKPLYTMEQTMESLLFMGMLNRDLRTCYHVQPANRMLILPTLIKLLAESHDVIVLRLDVRSFFESIPFNYLLEQLEDDDILCPESLYLLRKLNEAYKSVSGEDDGVPRGIGCSSYLAEIYLRDVDTRIKKMPGVFYYQRYVDDIVMLVYPISKDITPDSYFEKVSKLLEGKKLSLHTQDEEGKTKLIDSRSCNVNFSFDYLGYNIHKDNNKVIVTIAEEKYERYICRINEAFDTYMKSIHHMASERPLATLLLKLRAVTSNYNLVGSKNHIKAGIYYKYPYLTNKDQLKELDELLQSRISEIQPDVLPQNMGKYPNKKFSQEETAEYIRRRCEKYKFIDGYEKVKHSSLSSDDFQSLKKWYR